MAKIKIYYFPIVISGSGETMDEAWESAVEGFSSDPGLYDSENVEVEEIEE